MQNAIAESTFVTRQQINRLASLDEQTRDITVLTFGVEHFSTAKAPAEDEIKQYYEANMQRFMEPEKVKVDYVEIVSESLNNAVEVDESKIEKMYEQYVSIVKGREERKARHILLETSGDKAAAKDKIESIRKEIENGADFADLAKQYSDDKGSAAQGGDLGWVALGDMVKPFENALFAMKLSDNQASVSEVVESQFGYHLIKLEDVRSEAIEPLAVKRYEFEEELKADSVASLFYDLSERLASTAYENPDSLDAVVEELELKVSTTDYFTRNSGKGISDNAKLRDIAYSSLVLEQGSNSDIIEISPTHVVVIRLNEHVPAKAIPLENVSSRIEAILEAESGHEQTRAAALDVKSRIEAGESISDLQADGVSIEDINALGRMDNARTSDPAVLRTAFDMISAEDGKPVIRDIDLMSGDVALVVLNKVNIPESVSKDKMDLVKNTLRRENSVRDFSNVLLSIKENADIDRNRRMLER
jgi:peptidyl-prolyl cis-trans isomerase D